MRGGVNIYHRACKKQALFLLPSNSKGGKQIADVIKKPEDEKTITENKTPASKSPINESPAKEPEAPPPAQTGQNNGNPVDPSIFGC